MAQYVSLHHLGFPEYIDNASYKMVRLKESDNCSYTRTVHRLVGMMFLTYKEKI